MSTALHIIRLVLDRRELTRIARRHHLGRNVDEGYLLHAGLAQLFATSSEPAHVPLQTFAVDDTLRQAHTCPDLIFLLGYSDLDRRALVQRMGMAAESLVRSCESKEVPSFPEGTCAAFRVRICPIVRTRRPVAHQPGTARAGQGRIREVDAWLTSPEAQTGRLEAVREKGLPFEHSAKVWSGREAAYREWLAKELGRNGAAALANGVRLASFTRDRLYRRNGKVGSVLERPNAVMEGTVHVESAKAFRAVIRRGVGRHRAFGFGMLLLRPMRG